MNGWRAAVGKLLVGLAVAGLVLMLLEGVTRLLPLDRWERTSPSVSPRLFIPGEGAEAGFFVTNPHFGKAMSQQRFARTKPPGVTRVFVLGGSAALGWPEPVGAAFSGYLQRAFDQATPGRFEFINAAAMSYGSHRVLDLLADIVELDPDLVIIWSGNNEYIERNALPSLARTETMGRLQRELRRSALYRGVRLALGAVAPGLFARPDGPDITDPRSAPQVRRGMLGRSATMDREVLENYRGNLRTMAELLRRNRVAGIFCTIPVNLSGWVPINIAPEIDGPSALAAWEAVRGQAFRAWEEHRHAEAAAGLERLLAMTPRYAFAHYLLGDSYRSLGRYQEALREFNAARDLDPRPVRALSIFSATVREVAAGEGFGLADLEAAFVKESGPELSGLDLFLDYVHPNEIGRKLAAATVLAEMRRRIDPGLPFERLLSLIAADDWLERHDENRADRFYTLGMTLQNNGDLNGAEQAYLKALAEDPGYQEPNGNLGTIYEHRGDLATARDYYQRAVRIDPGSLYNADLARVLYRLGDLSGALEAGGRLLNQGVVNVALLALLGDVSAANGQYSEAAVYYQRTVEAGDSSAELQRKLADVYRRMGDEPSARRAEAQAALRLRSAGSIGE